MSNPGEKIRLDKWLWAARFFKTRALAQEAVSGGKVHLNGERVKPARHVEAGDRLEITKGEQRFTVQVEALSDKRGPAKVAETLYAETEESRKRREEAAAMRRLVRQSAPHPDRKPDKKQRRHIIRFKSGD
ncbi:MAG TPA: S4 domain-containing protein [Gammaproteobacteria bacterium]